MTCLAPTCTPYLTLISTVNNNTANNYNLDSDSENVIKDLFLASIYCLSFNNCLFIAEFLFYSISNKIFKIKIKSRAKSFVNIG